MNLLEMASFICTKVNQTDPEDLAACKLFLKQRHGMIWDAQPWKDAIAMVTVVADPELDPLVAAGQVLLPRGINRVLAIRVPERALAVAAAETYYRYDVDAFAASGTAREFLQMPPAYWVRAPGDERAVGMTATAEADWGLSATANVLDDQGEQLTLTMSVNPNTAGYWDDLAGGMVAEIYSITKPVSAGRFDFMVQLTPNGPGSNPDSAYSLAANVVSSVARPRVRLVQAPTEALSLNVLAKMKFSGFEGDSDEMRLTSVDDVLLPLVQGDMLQRERQYGKANLCYQEAGLQLGGMVKAETAQAAYNKRIVPDGGFGDVQDFYSQRMGLVY